MELNEIIYDNNMAIIHCCIYLGTPVHFYIVKKSWNTINGYQINYFIVILSLHVYPTGFLLNTLWAIIE